MLKSASLIESLWPLNSSFRKGSMRWLTIRAICSPAKYAFVFSSMPLATASSYPLMKSAM